MKGDDKGLNLKGCSWVPAGSDGGCELAQVCSRHAQLPDVIATGLLNFICAA
jgi:hypothetical protein